MARILRFGDFVGREALEKAERACRTWGMRVTGGVAILGRAIKVDGQVAGRVCSSGWSLLTVIE